MHEIAAADDEHPFIAQRCQLAPQLHMPGGALRHLNGKLRYQACNNKECLPPRTVDVRVTLDIQ